MPRDDGDGSPAPNSSDGISLETLPLHSTNLLTALDKDGIIRYESPAIERIFGFEQAELIGEQVADYFHPEDRERVRDAYRTVVATDGGAVESVEYRHRRADGSYLWVESVASSNPTPDEHYVVNTRDISERKRREQRLKQKNERLNEFANIVSHDLRNPLNIAMGHVELIERERSSDHLRAVRDAHDRMKGLIDDLLTLARSGKQVTEIEPVELAELSDDCWQNVSTQDATIESNVEGIIRADRGRAKQLLENLYRNAIEHAGEDVTLEIGKLCDRDGFYVADDSPGIPSETRNEVFRSGYSTRDDGTGLGLPIVEDIATAHGWEIDVTESDEGGSRFEISGVEFE